MKTTLHTKLTRLKHISDNERWQGCAKAETLGDCGREGNMAWPLWKTVWQLLKKLDIELP